MSPQTAHLDCTIQYWYLACPPYELGYTDNGTVSKSLLHASDGNKEQHAVTCHVRPMLGPYASL